MTRRAGGGRAWLLALAAAPLAACHLLLDVERMWPEGARPEASLQDGLGPGRPDRSTCAWPYRRRLILPFAPQSTLTSFPALLELSATDAALLKAGRNGLRFHSAGHGPAPFEVEQWSPTTAAIWVRLPMVPAGDPADQVWVYHGNPSPSTPPAPSSQVWSEGYLAVWHMTPATTTATKLASSPSTLDLTLVNGTTLGPQPGQSGAAVSFDGQKFLTAQLPLPAGPPQFTLEACFRITDLSIGEEAHLVEFQNTQFMIDQERKLEAGTSEEFNADLRSPTAVTLNQWHCAAFVQAPTPIGWALYLDGELQATGPDQTAPGPMIFVGDIYNHPKWEGTTELIGLMDEVRISTVPRSRDWIAATHRSFEGLSLGPEEPTAGQPCPE